MWQRRHLRSPQVYLAYTDESGDSGYVNSPTKFFVINCVLIHETAWQGILNSIIDVRRELKDRYGIPVRNELKAAHFVYKRGPFQELDIRRSERIGIYSSLLDFEANLDMKTFSIAVAKDRIKAQETVDPRAFAWQVLMQRLDTFCRKQASDCMDRVILLPDEGHGTLVRRLMRKARRFQNIKGSYGGVLDIKARFLIEDPLEKKSDESYFIQLADWNAYAAHHYKDIGPNKKAPNNLWDRLNDVLLLDVNAVAGGPPGIVLWPRSKGKSS